MLRFSQIGFAAAQRFLTVPKRHFSPLAVLYVRQNLVPIEDVALIVP